MFFKASHRGGVGGGRYASAHEVSPVGFQENFSFGEFPTICSGAKTLKQRDKMVVGFGWVFLEPADPLQLNFLTLLPIQACALEHGTRLGPRLYVSPPPGDSRVSGSLLSGPDGPASCSPGPQAPSAH